MSPGRKICERKRKKARKKAADCRSDSPSLVEGAVTYFPTFAVSSAWSGLTSLFGMGRGGALTLLPP